MFPVIWRLAALVLLAPFVVFPFVNFIAFPVALYLLFSLAAIAWRRHAGPAS